MTEIEMEVELKRAISDMTEIELEWITTKIRFGDLKPYEHNPRFIKSERYQELKKSILEDGYAELIEVDTDMTIISGHQRVHVMQDIGLSPDKIIEVRMPERKLTEKEFKRHLLRANQIYGEYDYDILSSSFELDELFDCGFTPESLGMDDMPNIEEEEENNIPEKQNDPITVLGDIYQLGNHRLMCGDSTIATDVDKLFDGNSLEITFTSPPYNLGKSIKVRTNTKSKSNKNTYNQYNDDNPEWKQLISDFLGLAMGKTDVQIVNLQMLAGNKIQMIEWLNDYRNKLSDIMFWQKYAAPAMAEKVMNSEVEFMFIFSEKDKPTRAISTAQFKRGTYKNWLEFPPVRNNENADIHLATMPLSLPVDILKNFCSKSVYDPFLGSGTTLIAAESTNRICYGIEIDTLYCDVIVKRYINFMEKTDKQYTISCNGKPCLDKFKENYEK